jgi:hypothetical protein
MSYNQLYKPLVDDPEAGGSSSSSSGPAAPPLRSYAPSESKCAKLGGIIEKIFCCCGLCQRLPCCPPLKRGCAVVGAKWQRLKAFLFQSSSVCHMAWLVVFLLALIIFAILMATLLSKVDDPYN